MLAGPIRNESVTSRLEEQPLVRSPRLLRLCLIYLSQARRKASEGKRKAGELSRERARLAREQQKEAKKHQKELDRAVRAAARAGSKEHSPAQRLKNMVVLLDQTLAENSNFMAEFAPALHALDGKLRISQLDEPGVVKWLRIESECGVDENARITKRSMEVEEKEMLVTMEAQGFVGLVHYSKQVKSEFSYRPQYLLLLQEAAGGSLPDGAVTLERYVDQLYASYPGAQISIAIEGIEAFFR